MGPKELWRVRYSASAAPSPVMRVSLFSSNHKSEQTNLSAGAEWAEEFADLTSADAALHPDTAEGREAYKRDFWKSLEDDWKEAADADHPWLNEFSSSYEPFKDYEFREENPLAETSNPLEEGKQRLEAVSFTYLIKCIIV